MPGTRKLGRATDSRNAMLRAMVTYLFEKDRKSTRLNSSHPSSSRMPSSA